ncbi:MAG: hypothetical protein AB7F99_19010, partial [Vicinamibacterales bacterium]
MRHESLGRGPVRCPVEVARPLLLTARPMEVTGLTEELMVADWLSIVRGEFMEVPGLRLTRGEFQR